MKIIKKISLLFIAVATVSCSNTPSLQKYFVENTESSDFINIDLGSSVINTEKMELTSSQKEAVESFEKLNILAFQKEAGQEVKYASEKEKITQILQDKSYEQLVKFGSNDKGAAVYLVGSEEKIDEFVLFASNDESGFIVARFLGDDMTPNDVMNLVDVVRKADLNLEELKPLESILKDKDEKAEM